MKLIKNPQIYSLNSYISYFFVYPGQSMLNDDNERDKNQIKSLCILSYQILIIFT